MDNLVAMIEACHNIESRLWILQSYTYAERNDNLQHDVNIKILKDNFDALSDNLILLLNEINYKK